MALYNEHFFDNIRTGSHRSAEEIVPLIMDLLHPRSVLDVGCGVGAWLEVFRQHGVDDIFGVDGSYVETQTLEIPAHCFAAHDLTQPLSLSRPFDLVMSLEVAEHLPHTSAETFIASLTRLGPAVLFSAAIPFQGGTHHVNEQWPEYWAAYFQRHDYVALDCLRPRLWQNAAVEWWYAQNMLLFVHKDRVAQYPALRGASASSAAPPAALVHPRKYLEVVDTMQRLIDTIQDLASLIPPDEAFILVDEDQVRAVVAAGRRAFPFLEQHGAYWGPPLDDDTAIRECERLRAAGAHFIVFAWPAFWWLDYYAVFQAHLRAQYTCVLQNDRLIAFEM
jgi:SAM-dependent methyltransferase